MSQETLAAHYLDNARARFRELKGLADRAAAQVDDAEFFRALDAESNSIAVIMKHVAGNLRSRWTDFLTSDGEKPDRHRDAEFEAAEGEGRDIYAARWESGWKTLFDTLDSLAPEDLLRRVPIRGEPHTVVEAINRQLTHYGMHVGQIVFLAKHLKSSGWQTLSVPRGQSGTFNEEMRRKHPS